jgi:hypothetical protein
LFCENTAYLFNIKLNNQRSVCGYNTHIGVRYTDSSCDAFFKSQVANSDNGYLFESDYTKTIEAVFMSLKAKENYVFDLLNLGIYPGLERISVSEEKREQTRTVYLKRPLCSLENFGNEAHDTLIPFKGKVERNVACETLSHELGVLKTNGEYPIYFLPLLNERDDEVRAHYLEYFTPVNDFAALEGGPMRSFMSYDCAHVFISAMPDMSADKLSLFLKEKKPRIIYKLKDPICENIEKPKRMRLWDFNRISVGKDKDTKIKILY